MIVVINVNKFVILGRIVKSSHVKLRLWLNVSVEIGKLPLYVDHMEIPMELIRKNKYYVIKNVKMQKDSISFIKENKFIIQMH